MTEYQLLKKLILDGIELTYGKLTLCNLEHYQRFRGERKWQVYCDDKKLNYPSREPEKRFICQVYQDLDEAIRKFLELKQKISARVR